DVLCRKGSDVSAVLCPGRLIMAPYEADRHKKERDALNLIIAMKKQKQTTSSGWQVIFFVVMPLVLALVIMRSREILVFAQQNKQVSAVIKIFYPGWKSADDFPKPVPRLESETEATKQDAHGKEGVAEAPAKSGKGTPRGSAKHHAIHPQPSAQQREHPAL